jgi:hypothetical protein
MPAEKLRSFASLDGQSIPSDGHSAPSDGQSVPSDGKPAPTPRTLTPALPPGVPIAPRTPLPTEAARKRSRYADIWESMAHGNVHMSIPGEQSHHPKLINPPAVSSSQYLKNDQQRENTSDHISLPVFRQHQVQGCALPPTLPPGIGLGELRTGPHNSGQNHGAPQIQSPLAQEFTTATPTEQNAPTDFASGGNLSNRRWRSPPSTGRPRRVYIPAPSLSTNNRELVREPQASVPNRFSTPVRATSAAVVCPTRQPRGPPPIEVLLTKPTSQHEGSKNFAARGRGRQSSGFVSTGVARTTSGNTAAPVSVSGIVSTGVTRTTSINTAAASISSFVSTGVARTTSGNTSAVAVSGTTGSISEHGGLVSEDTKNVASSAANRNGR